MHPGVANAELAWSRLMIAYGDKWREKVPTMDNPTFAEWAEVLRNVKPIRVLQAVRLSYGVIDNKGWPPNLAQFYQLTRQAAGGVGCVEIATGPVPPPSQIEQRAEQLSAEQFLLECR